MKEACIVGFGMIDALGDNPIDCWENMLNDRDFHKPIDPHVQEGHGLKVKYGFYPEVDIDENFTNRTVHYGMYAVEQAIHMSGLPHSSNVGVIFSTLTGGNTSKARARAIGKPLKPKQGLKVTIDYLCSNISIKYGYTGINTCVYSACATGLVSIDYAMRMLDEYDYVIVGAGSAGIAAALEQAGRARDVVFITHELTEDTRRALIDGTIDIIINQDAGHEVRSAIRVLMSKADRAPIVEQMERIRIDIYLRDNIP